MVVGQAPPGELELLRLLHCVHVVIAQDAAAVLVVQRQAVTDPMPSMLRLRNPPRLDPGPAAALMLQDAAIQIEKCLEADVRSAYQ
jgi:hypothetical protein